MTYDYTNRRQHERVEVVQAIFIEVFNIAFATVQLAQGIREPDPAV